MSPAYDPNSGVTVRSSRTFQELFDPSPIGPPIAFTQKGGSQVVQAESETFVAGGVSRIFPTCLLKEREKGFTLLPYTDYVNRVV